MKKIISVFIIAFTIFGCSKENKIKNNIETYLNKHASAPKTYEFVELKMLDTITKGEIAERQVKTFETDITEINEEIIRDQVLISKFPTLDNDAQKIQIKGNKEYLVKITPKVKALKKQISNKEIVGYEALHTFRINNAFGALTLNDQYVSFDKDFNVLSINVDVLESYSIYDDMYLADLEK